jgi:hypothetical protein
MPPAHEVDKKIPFVRKKAFPKKISCKKYFELFKKLGSGVTFIRAKGIITGVLLT